MSKVICEREDLVAIADAIREKNGLTDGYKLGEMAGAISNIGKKEKASYNDVMFIDYDGTILYSYSTEEAQNLTELPPLPTHDGLICQGWNWTLDEIKEYTDQTVTVGAMYITDDGKTRIYITLQEGRTSPMLGVCPNGTVTVDWGDGSEPDILTGTSTSTVKWTSNHEYAKAGDYVVSLTVDGKIGFYGSSQSDEKAGILRHTNNADVRNKGYQNSIQRIEIGSDTTSIGSNAFSGCCSMINITIPEDIISIHDKAFYGCYSLVNIGLPKNITSLPYHMVFDCRSLRNIAIPEGITSANTQSFGQCYCLKNIILSKNITSLSPSMFSACHSLVNIVIPKNIIFINSSSFSSCYSMKYYDFTRHTSVPTLSSTDAFTGIPEDCEILVPSALYDEWIMATNWSTYADHIVAR